MSVISGPEIQRLVGLGDIVIQPFDPKLVNSNSYNLRLGSHLTVYEKGWKHHQGLSRFARRLLNQPTLAEQQYVTRYAGDDWAEQPFLPEVLDMAQPEKHVTFEIQPEGFVMYPGVLYLGSTMEYTETPKHVPTIEGRSSVGRLGLTTHVTAGFGDQGFNGTWTLELSVVQPLRVYAGVEICQIVYSTIEGEPKPYCGKYQGQRPPQPSGLWREFNKESPKV